MYAGATEKDGLNKNFFYNLFVSIRASWRPISTLPSSQTAYSSRALERFFVGILCLAYQPKKSPAVTVAPFIDEPGRLNEDRVHPPAVSHGKIAARACCLQQ